MSLISVLQSLNGALFLNTTCVIVPSSISSVLAAFLLLTVIFPVTQIYALELSFDFNELVKNFIFSCE